MQQAAVFCKELSPTKTEHLMNRAREELHKLEKVTKTKQLKTKKRTSSPEQEQSKNKAEMDVLSLVKAKKNEMCVSEENDLKITRVKEKKKKHKSKSKDYISESSELNSTLSLGLHVKFQLADSTNEKNDVLLNPKHVKTTITKHTCQDSAPKLKEKTEKKKSDDSKKQKGARQANSESVCRTSCQNLLGKESPEIITGNQENLEKNKIDLLLSVIKTDKRKKHKTMKDLEETVCTIKEHRKKKSRRKSSPVEEITSPEENAGKRKKHKILNELENCDIKEHRKRKARRESSPLEETVCPENIESSRNKTHKNDRNDYNSILQQKESKKKKQKSMLADSLIEMNTEHKSKRKKRKQKDTESEDVDNYSEDRKNKKSNSNNDDDDDDDDDKDESLHMDSNNIKKMKKKKTLEYTESMDDSHSDMYCIESLTVRKSKKHKHSRNTENADESLTSHSSVLHRAKRKQHKDAKESDESFTDVNYGELKDNTQGANITETENCYSAQSPHKRKHTKRKKSPVGLEVSDAEICNNKKNKEKVAEIMTKPKRKKHREDIDEFVEPIELQKKSKKRKSTEEEVMQSTLELIESKKKKESKCVNDSKSTKHGKKGSEECRDVEDTDCSSKNIKEINTNKTSDFCSAEFLGQSKKVKKKRRSFNESDEMQNAALEGIHHMENSHVVDSEMITKNSEHKRRRDDESLIAAVSHHSENEKREKKSKKRKSKERERAEISSEMNSSCSVEICGERSCTSQNVQIIETPACKANTTFGRSPMERLLYGDPDSMVTETCTHCLQCSHRVIAKPSPIVNTVNVKQEKTGTPQLQAVAVKPCVVDNIVNTIVIKKEPGLETEDSNSEVIAPINLIDINNLKIKQEPGLEIPSDQANESIQLNFPKDHKQLIECIKKEPDNETQNNSNADVSSMNMLGPEADQHLPYLKKEHVVEERNTNTDGAIAAEGVTLGLQNAAAGDAYLSSVISAEDVASGFFRHASTNANNIAASDKDVHEGKTLGQKVPASSSADIKKREAGDNVPDIARFVATSQQWDLPKHEQTSKEASFNSEMSTVPYKQPLQKEEWIYELHMIDVPYKVHFHHIADYFRVPLSKVREYRGYGRRPGYKHVVVSLSNYSTCLRMSKKRRLFGSKHTFIWSFKKYTS